MKTITVTMKNGTTQTYQGDCVRTNSTEHGNRSPFTEICTSTEKITPEYSWLGKKKRDWSCWSFEQVALITTENIDRIELNQGDS